MKPIKELIEERIALEQEMYDEHKKVEQILKEVHGKKLTKRTFMKYPEFEYEQQYGQHSLIGKYRHLIGCGAELVGDREFKYIDLCHYACLGRIEQLKAIDADKLQAIRDRITDAMNDILLGMSELDRENLDSFSNPIFYEMFEGAFPKGVSVGDLFINRRK